MTEKETLQTFRGLEQVRDRTRTALLWGWLPFLVFGTATLVSAPISQVNDGEALGVYWLVAGPLALAVTLLGYRRMEIRSGVVERNEALYAGLIAAILVSAMAIGFLADDGIASEVGPLVPVGIGMLAISAVDRSRLVAVAGALILVLAFALAVAGPANAGTWAAAGEGALLIGAGLIARRPARQGHGSPSPADFDPFESGGSR
jgi:hypothetical protein